MVANPWCDENYPPHWSDAGVVEVHGARFRFGIATANATQFDEAADYNRDHALVRVIAFSLNRWDHASFSDDGKSVLDSTHGIGSDFVAEVISVGRQVTDLGAGHRVVPCADWPSHPGIPGARGLVSTSASRQLLRLPANGLMKVSESITDEAAAALSMSAQSGYAMVRRLDPQPGQHVTVCGASSDVGLAALGALACRNIKVSVLDAAPEYAPLLRKLGVSQVLQSGKTGLDSAWSYAASIGGFDGVLDARSSIDLRPVELLGFSGRYVACGMRAEVPDDLATALPSVISKNITIIGNNLGIRADLADALQHVAEGRWEPVIDSVYTESQLTEFLEREFGTKNRIGRVIFRYPRSGNHE
ncbi:zinc-binding dehydrogenase [Streptomyces aurantiacus]|nr:zinc-binding alcohol dehydrogenase family protein [Streptomyces aurantiacus]